MSCEMDKKQFNQIFNKALVNAVRESKTLSQIELPPSSVIDASWKVVQRRLEEEQQKKYSVH